LDLGEKAVNWRKLMKILIRKQKESEWDLVKSAGYDAETELQELLAESPSLIAINEIREGTSPLLVAIKEMLVRGLGDIFP
jgi:hypothetical protein